MTKLHRVNKARHDYPDAGIKKGESYYWWKFRFGGKHMSKTRPPRSALTQSAFWGVVFDIQDQHSEAPALEDMESQRDEIVDALNNLKDEQQEKLDNMPQQLQDAKSGQLLQERMDAIDSAISDLESLDFSVEEDPDDERGEQEIRDEKWDEVTSALDLSCS